MNEEELIESIEKLNKSINYLTLPNGKKIHLTTKELDNK